MIDGGYGFVYNSLKMKIESLYLMFKFDQYLNEKTLDISAIKYNKLLVVDCFKTFIKELNNFISSRNVTRLCLDYHLFKELLLDYPLSKEEEYVLFNTKIKSLKINKECFQSPLSDIQLRLFFKNNCDITEIDCTIDDANELNTITYSTKERTISLKYTKTNPPIWLHEFFLAFIYNMSTKDILLYNKTRRSKNNETTVVFKGHTIPEMEYIYSRTTDNYMFFFDNFKKLCFASCEKFIDEIRSPFMLFLFSISLACLIIQLFPAPFVIAAPAGMLSGFALYLLGRNTILPTLENAMEDYTSVIPLPRF